MNKPGKYKQNRLIAGLVSLLSLSLLAGAPFERNPQDCQMVSITIKKKKDTSQPQPA